MKYSFDSPETKSAERQLALSSSSTPEFDQVEWLPLQNHPVFSSTTTATASCASVNSSTFRMPTNLLAWDGASRLYFWDPDKQCLHRISIRLGDPDPASVLAASPSKVLRADVQLKFVVSKISINRNGSALLLAGPDGLSVMYLYVCSSTKDGSGPSICRAVSIGSQIYSSGDNVIRTLKISWHPCSDTHMAILSSDSVFRIFDLSSALEQPEQEYYLQPVEPGRCRNAASICPVDFSFGSDHLWDRFSVFVLFSDGSVYILCPVVPFGSVYKWESILEIHHDAQTFGLESSYPRAVSNSNMAITWLEATFPELSRQATGGILSVKAQPYALFDSSISFQGPLPKVGHGGEEDTHVQVEECEGRAVSLLYNAISKDSILVTAWSGGQLQIDALADEIQPVWIFGTPPRICVNSHDCIVRVAMICESVMGDPSTVKLCEPSDHNVWSGYPPPLLRLAMVDLALPRNRESTSLVSMVADPLIPENIFTLHDGGIDSIVLHFLPFTDQISGKNESLRTPSVHPVLCTSQGGSSFPLIGFLVLSDSYGYSWIVGLTSSRECIVLEMKAMDPLLAVHVEREEVATLDEARANDNQVFLSKELLSGPKAVLLPPSNLRSVTADSIEGRSTLHHYFKLFHENYVEYAHKVYIELKHHGPLLKKIIEDHHGRLHGAQQKLLKVEEKQEKLEDRITHATQVHSLLEERLQRLRNLPGLRNRPLSKAEREFKSELDRFTGVELDALHSSIEALNSRLQRYAHSPQGNPSNQRRQISELEAAVGLRGSRVEEVPEEHEAAQTALRLDIVGRDAGEQEDTATSPREVQTHQVTPPGDSTLVKAQRTSDPSRQASPVRRSSQPHATVQSPNCSDSSVMVVEASHPQTERTLYKQFRVLRAYVPVLEWIVQTHPETLAGFKAKSEVMGGMWLDNFCALLRTLHMTTLVDFSTSFYNNVRASFVDLEDLGFDISWIVAHLDRLHKRRREIKLLPQITDKEYEITVLQKEIEQMGIKLKKKQDELAALVQEKETLSAAHEVPINDSDPVSKGLFPMRF